MERPSLPQEETAHRARQDVRWHLFLNDDFSEAQGPSVPLLFRIRVASLLRRKTGAPLLSDPPWESEPPKILHLRLLLASS